MIGRAVRSRFFPHFAHPRGVLGWLAGRVMGVKNTGTNLRLVEVLDIQPTDVVLDIGCGPGVAVAAAAERAVEGLAVGVDAAPVVVGIATRRNRRGIRAGRVRIVLGEAEALPLEDASVDRVCSMNSIGHWHDVQAGLAEVARVLRPAGVVALGLRSRSSRGAPPTPPAFVRVVVAGLAGAGLELVDVREEAVGDERFTAVVARRPPAS